MKKYIIPFVAAILAMSAFSASAQSSYPPKQYKYTYVEKKKVDPNSNPFEQKWVTSYIKASVSVNHFSMKDNTPIGNLDGFNILNVSQKPVVGYNVAAGFQYKLAKKLGLYLGADIGIGSRGNLWQYSSKPVLSVDPEVTLTKQYFTHSVKLTPLQIGYRFNVTYSFCIDPHIGGYVSYDIAGKEKVNVITGYSNSAKETNIKDDETYNRFDAGINPGIALWFGPFGVDFTYQRGFINANKDENNTAEAYTENFLIGLAFRF